jgi:protein-S-isoprenylcysteine O-methyltransferase Ste14
MLALVRGHQDQVLVLPAGLPLVDRARPARFAVHARGSGGHGLSLARISQLWAKDEEQNDSEENELYRRNNEKNNEDIGHAESTFAYHPSIAGRGTATPLPYTQSERAANLERAKICSKTWPLRSSPRPSSGYIRTDAGKSATLTTSATRGQHASRWVVAQIPLLALTVTWPVAQLMLHASGPWIGPLGVPTRALGLGLLAVAFVVFRAAKRMLGPALVATPMPVPDATLRDTGVYGAVRHPIYAAIISGVFGWALLWNSAYCLALAVLCGLFFLAKTRYEEALLLDSFPPYEEYRSRVPGLIPRLWKL